MDLPAQNTPKLRDITKKKGAFICMKISEPSNASNTVILTRVFQTFVALSASHVIWQNTEHS
jgi:hypothetical protein